MKNKILFIVVFSAALVACSKSFLEKPPLDTLANSNFYQTPDQLLQGTAALYNKVWFSYNYKAVQMMELRAGSFFGIAETGDLRFSFYKNFSVPGTDVHLEEAWKSFYNTVGQANMVIESINTYSSASIPEAAKKNAIAEARFMRGLAYSYMVQIWKDIPVIESNLTLLTDTSKRRNTYESVWDFIISDLRYAAENLYAVAPKSGRLTKYAGEAMLARMYLTRAGVGSSNGTRRQTDLDSAAILCRDVIANGPYKMLDDYAELFKIKNNNNTESIFALQSFYQTSNNWGTGNPLQAYYAFTSAITGVGDGWGGSVGAGYNTLKMYEDLKLDKRRQATYMLPGDSYPNITAEVNNVKQPLVVPLTFNFQDGSATTSSMSWIKKYVVGRPEDKDNNGQVLMMSTGLNTYMMRMSEVYLTLAEAILGNNTSTTNAEALAAFNKIRNRAGLNSFTTITWDDIYKERMLEFSMENMSAFDFARLQYYNPAKAYSMLSAMYRGKYIITPLPSKTNPTSWKIEMDPNTPVNEKYAIVTESNFYFRIPDGELTRAPALLQPPVPYNK